MKRSLSAIPITVGAVSSFAIGTILIITGMHGLIAATGILFND